MSTVFVTASGTEIGKTFVACALIHQLRRGGRSVSALKPVATGISPETVSDSDSALLLQALGVPAADDAVAAITPWRFPEPLSPDMAAARAHASIPFDELVAFCQADRGTDVTLIEGIGGVMVPLDRRHTVLDWIAALGAPALLVTGSYLGTLSHTLTAVGMLRARRRGTRRHHRQRVRDATRHRRRDRGCDRAVRCRGSRFECSGASMIRVVPRICCRCLSATFSPRAPRT